uniref:Uncharacterized protein n=1 Tax=Maylandia zebra TaxID=106582 RepID=A0A3P9CFP7_9CICH
KAFPHEKLRIVETNVSDCNSNITPRKTVELESLLLGLERRLSQLNKDVQILEKEDDGELYGVLSLYVIENEMTEIKQLIDKLNSTTQQHQILTANTTEQLDNLKAEMQELERFDTMQVIKGQYAYGAWGRDPRPEEGKESWYWLVMLTSSNIYAHYVRLYSSLSSLIIGVSV